MELDQSKVILCGISFEAMVEAPIGTEEFLFMKKKFLTGQKVEGLMSNFGYSGAVVITGQELIAKGSELTACFYIRGVN